MRGVALEVIVYRIGQLVIAESRGALIPIDTDEVALRHCAVLNDDIVVVFT